MKTSCWMTLVANTNDSGRRNSEHGSLFLFVLLLTAIGLLTACEQAPTVQQTVLQGPIMGTDYRITIVHSSSTDLTPVRDSVMTAMESVNQSMSTYLKDSEISRFNRRGAGDAQVISDDMATVIEEAMRIGRLTDGAFDLTIGPVVNAWGFGPDGRVNVRPSPEQLAAFEESIGYQKISLDGSTLIKESDSLELDLSAIAKGYAVDKVADALLAMNLSRFLINIGGELRASGRSLDGSEWRVGIEKPHILGGIQQVVRLNDQAIATSGDYRNYLIIDGQKFSHTISAITLKPVLHRLALVSVISEQAMTADALATALMAMGEDQAWEFAQRQGLAAYLLVRGDVDGEFTIRVTDKFATNLQ